MGSYLKTALRISEAQLAAADFQYMNMIAAYMLHSLANSQSMGKLQAGFKSVKGMKRLMDQRFPALEDGLEPLACVTRETLAYTWFLSV